MEIDLDAEKQGVTMTGQGLEKKDRQPDLVGPDRILLRNFKHIDLKKDRQRGGWR